MVNLYDLTKGNYHVRRTISYPDYPESRLVMEASVEAISDSEWSTTMTIDGTYDGPTDLIAQNDYQLSWSVKGAELHESGSSTLESQSGEAVRCVWTSVIMSQAELGSFPADGESVSISISPFKIDGNSMSYDWEGTVAKAESYPAD